MLLLQLVFLSLAIFSTKAWTETTISSYRYGSCLRGVGRAPHCWPTTTTTPIQTRRAFAAMNTDLFAKRVNSQHRWRFLVGKKESLTKKSASTDAAAAAGSESFRWTVSTVARALAVFVLSGIAEIGGGWLVWKAVREHKPWWWALTGSLVLVLYGFLPTLQPTDSFGRIYAVYGGFFIVLSYLWGWIFDGMKPDVGDVLGGSLALAAVLIILFWPRKQ